MCSTRKIIIMLLLLMMGMMLVNCFLFWSTQLNLNIDKSKVTMDSTPKLVSSQPVTQWGGGGYHKIFTYGTGAEATNKSGCSATFICGSTMSGLLAPPHF